MSPARRCPALDGRYCLLCPPAERCAEQRQLEDRAREASLNPCECGESGGRHTGDCERYL